MPRSLFIFLLLIASSFSHAHKLAPSLLQLTEVEPGVFEVYWKTPTLVTAGQTLEPVFPAHCRAQNPVEESVDGSGNVQRWRMACQQPMAGEALAVKGMDSTGTATVIKVQWLDGASSQSIINARSPSLSIPQQQTTAGIIAAYISLGAEHIWLGVDHLLFVLALVMLVKTTRKLVWTITAFTVGHSITLSLVSLGYLDYPVSLVEFTIALSILVLAIELARPQQGDHWIRNHSWIVAVSFGLLHGMGFAGALREVGLPAGDIPLALFSFNVGIELGQIVFVFICLGLGALALRYSRGFINIGRWLLVYCIGSLSAFWCIERGLATLAGG